jgi:hypothetical protein
MILSLLLVNETDLPSPKNSWPFRVTLITKVGSCTGPEEENGIKNILFCKYLYYVPVLSCKLS